VTDHLVTDICAQCTVLRVDAEASHSVTETDVCAEHTNHTDGNLGFARSSKRTAADTGEQTCSEQ